MVREILGKVFTLLLVVSAIGLVVYYSRPLPPTGKTLVRFLTYETGQQQMEIVNEIVRRFEAENPDIEIEVEFNARARDKLYVEMASGTSPDTFYVVTDDIPRLSQKGAIESLNEWVRNDPTADMSVFFPRTVNALQYPPNETDVLQWGGDLYAYPIHFSTDVLFYNKDAFDEGGVAYPTDDWTWDDMVSAARKLTKRDAMGRILRFGMFMPDSNSTILSNGGAIFNDDYTECVIYNDAAIEAVTAIRDLRFVERVAPTPADVQETASMQMFQREQLAMLPGRTYMAVDFGRIEAFRWDAALMPGMKMNVDRLAVGGIAMSKDSKNKEAAWRWMKFYCSPDGGGDVLGRLKNAVTAIEWMANHPDYFLQPPPDNARVFIDSLNDAYITVPPIVNAAEYMNRIRNPMIDDMLRAPNTNIPAMLKEFQDETNKLLATEPPMPKPRTEGVESP
jgi:multiple sugar transport system substrate-binding protein